MEDREIVALYFARSEEAIRQTECKYGAFCRGVARNILTRYEDAEECVNDTYHTAWNRMPPTQPTSLKAFLGRITRDLAIDRYRAEHAQKRGMAQLLSELDECVPAEVNTERLIEQKELTESVENYLRELEPDDRALFIRRYWYGEPVRELAKACGMSAAQTTQKLRRLRLKLKTELEEEGTA